MSDLTVEGRVQRIEKTLWIGNGNPPLADQVRKHGSKLDDLKTQVGEVSKKVDQLITESAAAENRKAGRVEVASWVKWALGAIGVLGPILAGLAYTNVVETLGRIAAVVNSLPPMP